MDLFISFHDISMIPPVLVASMRMPWLPWHLSKMSQPWDVALCIAPWRWGWPLPMAPSTPPGHPELRLPFCTWKSWGADHWDNWDTSSPQRFTFWLWKNWDVMVYGWGTRLEYAWELYKQLLYGYFTMNTLGILPMDIGDIMGKSSVRVPNSATSGAFCGMIHGDYPNVNHI